MFFGIFVYAHSGDRFLKTEAAFLQHFTLPEGQIIISADKNVGFVCMDFDDFLVKYDKINVQQHFRKIDVDEGT